VAIDVLDTLRVERLAGRENSWNRAGENPMTGFTARGREKTKKSSRMEKVGFRDKVWWKWGGSFTVFQAPKQRLQ